MALEILYRNAKASDVRAIVTLCEPYVHRRILVAKELIAYFEGIQEFIVAEYEGEIIGCGALHVMWDDIAEVRTLAVQRDWIGKKVGHEILKRLEQRARDLNVRRLFCLTFEVDFFARHGFEEIEGTPVGTNVYSQMLRSHDDGVAEFLDLAKVKPNTLGNTRMIKQLDGQK